MNGQILIFIGQYCYEKKVSEITKYLLSEDQQLDNVRSKIL